jgi:hypothetical protein
MQGVRGEVQELAVRSTRLAVVPVWVGELTRLEALEVIGVEYEQNTLLKSLSASLGQLVALTLAWLGGLEWTIVRGGGGGCGGVGAAAAPAAPRTVATARFHRAPDGKYVCNKCLRSFSRCAN